MKKRVYYFLAVVLLALLYVFVLTGCTENSRAKNFGGTAELELPANKKLILVTWKEDALWYLTRDMRPNETPEVYYFNEKSSWGVWEGTYIIKETKGKASVKDKHNKNK